MKLPNIGLIFVILNILALISLTSLLIYSNHLNQMLNIKDRLLFYESRPGAINDEHTRQGSEQGEDFRIQTAFQKGFHSVGDEINTYVYSAIYDDIEIPVIKVITLVRDLYKTDPHHSFTCTYPQTQGNSSRTFEGRLQYVPEPEWGYSYRSAFIRCEVPVDQRPAEVTVSQKGKSNGGNVLRVIYPLKKKWRVTRCFSVLHSNFSRTMQFIQTIEMSLMFGVDHFIVYNYQTHESVLRIMMKYQKMGVLDVFPWDLPLNKTQIHYFGQLAAIQECIYRNLHVSDYILTGDTDELFVPKIYNSTLEMIQANLKNRPLCSGLVVRNGFFPLNLPQTSEQFKFSSEARRLNLTYLLHTSRLKVDNPYERSKLILKPTGVVIGGIHDVKLYRDGQGGCGCQYNHCLLHHYRTVSNESLGSFRTNDTSLHQYAEVIVKQITDRFQDLKTFRHP